MITAVYMVEILSFAMLLVCNCSVYVYRFLMCQFATFIDYVVLTSKHFFCKVGIGLLHSLQSHAYCFGTFFRLHLNVVYPDIAVLGAKDIDCVSLFRCSYAHNCPFGKFIFFLSINVLSFHIFLPFAFSTV